MSTITKSITVDVPIRTAYDQWTQLESFPRFMDGVEAVAQRDDTHVHGKAKIGGVRSEWVAEIVDQAPDDLERFKAFIESRGRATGAWRGEVRPVPET